MKQRLGSEIALSGNLGAEGADRTLEDSEKIVVGSRYLGVRATPGHTAGCLTFVLDDEHMAFTGDCLLIRGSGRTDFHAGDPRQLYRAIHQQIFTLPDTCLLYPGHDYRGITATSVAEERAFNPRLGGNLSESDFAGYMDNLGLPHPKKIDIAVPANLRCGRPEDGEVPPDDPTWAPLALTFAGIWEIQPIAVEEHRGEFMVLDVREPAEFDGPLGHIDGARLLPLGELAERADELPRDQPIVAVCRAGGRSAQATVILKRAGFTDLANLAGGMLRWRAQELPVVGGSE